MTNARLHPAPPGRGWDGGRGRGGRIDWWRRVPRRRFFVWRSVFCFTSPVTPSNSDRLMISHLLHLEPWTELCTHSAPHGRNHAPWALLIRGPWSLPQCHAGADHCRGREVVAETDRGTLVEEVSFSSRVRSHAMLPTEHY